MESYHTRHKLLEDKYGKLINLKPYNDDNVVVSNKQHKYIKQPQDTTDDEGLRLAYETKYDLYQHYNELFIAGTKDWPNDAIDDLQLPFDDTWNETKRGRGADAYYRSHHEIDTVTGHSLGGAVALSLETQCKKEGDHPYGRIQSKTFGALTVPGKIKSPLLKNNNIVKDEIITAGAAGGLAIGASADAAIGFSDGGILSGLGADICKKVSSDFANRITEDNNTSPDGIRYFGDPVSMFDFNSTTVMPSMGFRWKDSAHAYMGLFIKDAVPIHGVEHNPLPPSPEDSKTEVITE